MLLEKLLISCPDTEEVYVLVRPKKGTEINNILNINSKVLLTNFYRRRDFGAPIQRVRLEEELQVFVRSFVGTKFRQK